jgi:threonine dehydratase
VLDVATWTLELLTAIADLDLFYVVIGLASISAAPSGSATCSDCVPKSSVCKVPVRPGLRSLDAGHVVQPDFADTKADGLAVRIPDASALAIVGN